ncbi:hypothetical protein KUTeg_023554 [Tegillarca granosa]|uniref:Uncharacterized protein n=1 Tax=Tegillarca granosa TaxID=220873 RepID=A0ABQ9E203_TEGGR|nr:hypothetical protein KUTeg_023554 [Tegillarca granosa]
MKSHFGLQDTRSCKIIVGHLNEICFTVIEEMSFAHHRHYVPMGNLSKPKHNAEEHVQTECNTKASVLTKQNNGSEFGEDIAYHTIHNVVHAKAARNHGKIQAENEIPNKAKSRKKKLRKRKDSESTQDSRIEKHNEEISDTCSKTTDGDGSLSTLTPRDNIHIPADYHLKNCNNEKLLHWLKEKNKEYRRQKRAEKEKKKEERQKKILEANEKFERMLESEKKVKQWMSKKKKEENHKKKVERETSRNRLDITLPGKSLGIRPISPGPRVMRKNFENESVEFEKEKSEETKIDSPEPVEQMIVGPHPPNSKFIYKRPVAGSIKLKIRNRPQSSPTTQVSKETKDSANKAKEAERMQKMRMSYDDWLKKKHQDDIERKKFEKKQKEIMSKSDPELNKIIPDIAKKRIHNVLEGKKRIDTGLHIFDNEKNKEFGGADFPNENIDESEDGERKTRCSYRLEEDRVKDSSDTSESKLKVDGTGIQKPGRPQTAPARVSRVPAPKLSSSSPRKAVVPAKVDDIMSNEDKTNPFRLPFSAEEGVPKHVASRQRKLFAEKTWQKLEDEERPEPQGCDSTEPSLCTTGSTQKTADSQATGIKDNKNESSSKTEQNSANNDVSSKTKEAKEIINIESRNVEDESIVSNSSAFLTQEIVETKSFLENDKEETSQTKDDKISSVDETDGNNIQDRDTDKKDQENENIENSDKSTNEDNSSVRNEENKDFQTSDNSEDDSNAKGDNSLDEGEKNDDKKNDETEDENQGKTEDVKLLGLDNLAEKDISTSRSSKHVSFRDETEVFGEGDQIIPPDLEWSTDTETPDDDNYQVLGENQETNKGEEGEINSSIDSYGNELDNNSPRINQMQTSTDDEF